MRGANKSVQDLNFKYFNNFFLAQRLAPSRGRLLRPLDLGLQRPGTQSEVEIWALGLGTIECRVKGDVTMTNWSR